MNKMIAFVGFKTIGKSTAAEYLKKEYGFVRHNFKDSLVAEIKEKFPDLLKGLVSLYKRYPELWRSEGAIKSSELPVTIGNLFIVKPLLVRELLVNYGTEVRRSEDPDYWVRKWKFISDWIDECSQVVDDVRFLNEAKAVKDNNGIIIRLTRPDITNGGKHSSETEQLQIQADYTIELIPGEVSLLYDELDKIINETS